MASRCLTKNYVLFHGSSSPDGLRFDSSTRWNSGEVVVEIPLNGMQAPAGDVFRSWAGELAFLCQQLWELQMLP